MCRSIETIIAVVVDACMHSYSSCSIGGTLYHSSCSSNNNNNSKILFLTMKSFVTAAVAATLLSCSIMFVTATTIVDANIQRPKLGGRRGRKYGGERRNLQEAAGNNNMNDHNEMFAMKNMPQEINVDPKKTYNSQFMPTMTSSCRPEVDGFFGATSGDYIKVQYGFQVETQPLSQINNVLNVVKDHIVDSILINTFPKMCGSRRTLHQIGGKVEEEQGEEVQQLHHQQREHQRSLAHTAGHPSGFRFLKFREEGTCQPTTVPTNFCGVVTGTVYVYGRHQDGKDASLQVLSHIENVLNVVDSTTIHSELLAIKPVKELNKVSGTINGKAFEDTNPGGNDGLSRTGILLVVIACLLVSAVAYYMYIRHVERKESDTMMASPPSKKRRQIQWRRPMRGLNKKFFQKSSSSLSSSSSKFKDYDVNQNSIYPKAIEEDHDDVKYEEEEIIEEEEYYEEGDDDEDYIDQDDFEYHDDVKYEEEEDVGGGLEGFVDELTGVDDEQRSQVSRYSHKSGQSRRSRTSEASSRRREEFERLREKTLLSNLSTPSSDDRGGSSSPYYDDDNHSGLV